MREGPGKGSHGSRGDEHNGREVGESVCDGGNQIPFSFLVCRTTVNEVRPDGRIWNYARM